MMRAEISLETVAKAVIVVVVLIVLILIFRNLIGESGGTITGISNDASKSAEKCAKIPPDPSCLDNQESTTQGLSIVAITVQADGL